MAQEAEIIHLCSRAGITLPVADEMELWELASAIGLHRVETLAMRDQREIVETKAEYWDETQDKRMAIIVERAERRKTRDLERRRAKQVS